jgi:hypothetical protein
MTRARGKQAHRVIFSAPARRTIFAPPGGQPNGTSGGNRNLWVLHDAAYVSDFDSPERIVEGAEGASPASKSNSASQPEWLRDPLGHIRRERRAEFETRSDNRKRAVRRPRVLVGGADRIENLLPQD